MVLDSQFCPACDQPIVSESFFCGECGTNLLLTGKINLADISTEITIDDNLVTNYVKLYHSLREMSDAEDIAEMQRNHCVMLENQKSELTKTLQQARLRLVKTKKDMEELQKLTWTSIKAKVKGDLDESLSKEEEEHLLATGQLKALLSQQTEITNQIGTSQKQLSEAYGLVNKKREIQNKLKELLKKIGEQIDHPEEDKLEDEANLIGTRFSKLEHEHFSMRSRQSYALSALNLYNIAFGRLEKAKLAPSWELTPNLYEYNQNTKRTLLNDARGMIHLANDQLKFAIEGLGENNFNEMPYVEELGVWTELLSVDLWTNLFTGIFAVNKISDSQASVVKAIKNAETVSKKYHDLIVNLDGELATIRGKYLEIDEKLEKERIKLIEKYIEKGN